MGESNAIPHPETGPHHTNVKDRAYRGQFKAMRIKFNPHSHPSFTPFLSLQPAYHEWRSFR